MGFAKHSEKTRKMNVGIWMNILSWSSSMCLSLPIWAMRAGTLRRAGSSCGEDVKEDRGTGKLHSEDTLLDELCRGCSSQDRFRHPSAGCWFGSYGQRWRGSGMVSFSPELLFSHFHSKQKETNLKALNCSATKVLVCIQSHFLPHLYFVHFMESKYIFQGCAF